MAVKKPVFSLFSKFALGISLTVMVFGALNALIIRNSVSRSLESEFEKRGYFIARTMAEQAVGYILSDNPAGLNLLVNEIKAIDPSVHYAFILDEHERVLAHTFNNQVPYALIQANKLPPETEYHALLIRDMHESKLLIRDFAMPALSRSVGIVRVGILENEINRQVQATMHKLWLMVLFFLLIGILGALFFSHIISQPLRVLSQESAIIDIRNIQEGLSRLHASTRNWYFRLRRMFHSSDEIDLLYDNYAEMLQRLEQTHNKLNQLQQSLLQSEKMASIGTLTAGIAHEINNPLAGIQTGLRRIAKNPSDVKQTTEYISMMQEALSRAEQVMRDLLTFSRQSHMECEAADICVIIGKVIKLAGYRIKGHRIGIHVETEDCPYIMHVSVNRMEQVFLNIMINAIDSIIERQQKQADLQGRIDISFLQGDGRVQIIFSDNGTGIKPEQMNKIFDPFFTTKKVGEGTGLGLSVSYQIIKDHGGRIFADEGVEGGCRMIVELPDKGKAV
jgi:two-component system, NtrC family, sensor kinase